MKGFLLGAGAFLAFAAPALAADMPARPYTKAPAYTAPQVVYNWTGFYIGGHVGGAFAGNNSLQSSDARFRRRAGRLRLPVRAELGGGRGSPVQLVDRRHQQRDAFPGR